MFHYIMAILKTYHVFPRFCLQEAFQIAPECAIVVIYAMTPELRGIEKRVKF